MDKVYVKLKKPCARCNKKFRPEGNFTRLCIKCREKAIEKAKRKNKKTWKGPLYLRSIADHKLL